MSPTPSPILLSPPHWEPPWDAPRKSKLMKLMLLRTMRDVWAEAAHL